KTLSGWKDIYYDSFLQDGDNKNFKPLSDAYAKLNELQKSLVDKETGVEYKTVAIDSLTYLGKMIVYYIATLTNHWDSNTKKVALQIQDWEAVAEELTKYTMAALSLPCHVIITSHEKVAARMDSAGNTLEVNYLPGRIGQKFPTECPGLFDEVYRMVVMPSANPNKRADYKVQTERDRKWVAKSRLNEKG